jgi:hypothetical protein
MNGWREISIAHMQIHPHTRTSSSEILAPLTLTALLFFFFSCPQDEEKPYVFISKTPLGVSSCTPAMRSLHDSYRAALRARSPDFETPGPVAIEGYPEPAPGKANLNICSAAVAHAFPGCLAMTLEMPYKGNDNAGPAAAEGFTTDQCKRLGAACVDAIGDVLPHLLR